MLMSPSKGQPLRFHSIRKEGLLGSMSGGKAEMLLTFTEELLTGIGRYCTIVQKLALLRFPESLYIKQFTLWVISSNIGEVGDVHTAATDWVVCSGWQILAATTGHTTKRWVRFHRSLREPALASVILQPDIQKSDHGQGQGHDDQEVSAMLQQGLYVSEWPNPSLPNFSLAILHMAS